MKWLRRFITKTLAHVSSLSINPFVKKLNDSNTNATKIKIKVKEDADEQHEEVVMVIGTKNEEEEDEEMMMVQMDGVFSKLPSDIFIDILSRVPIKSLSQCKWVCKTWFKIIHQPRFAEMQYAKQIQNTRCSPFIVVQNHLRDYFFVDSQVFYDFGTSTTASSLGMKGIDDAYKRKGLMISQYEVVGSVNGLICFGGYKSRKLPYYICNPITGDYIILPLSPKYEINHVKSEFGFSSTTNEYKVIRVVPENRDTNFLVEAEIFTLGSDSWRMIEGLPYGRCCNQSLLLNGYLHWKPTENMKPNVIVTFNVGTEELDVIQSPPYVKQVKNIYKNMLVLGENLCFIDADELEIDVWVMTSYGVATSWVKEYVINKSNRLNLHWFNNYEVMKLWNGELLLLHSYEQTLGYYDLKKGTFKPITVREMPNKDYANARPIMVSGSLFSPKNVHKLIKRNKQFRPAMLKRHNSLVQKWLSN